MAQLVLPGLVLVMSLLLTPQLVAAQLRFLSRGSNAKAFMKGFEKGLDIGQNLFGGSTPNPPDEGGNNNGDTYYCSTPTIGLQAPLRWTDDMTGYVVELGISGTHDAYDFLVATATNFVWTNQCRQLSASAALVPQACNSQQCGLLKLPCDRDPNCHYETTQMKGYLTNSSSFTLSDSKPFNLSFGCSDMVATVYNRVAGMGRGPLSLTSQLQISRFSYCFPDYFDTSISGQMFFGSYAVFDEGTTLIATTPFQQYADNYRIQLTWISFDASILSNTATLVVIDSSAALTYLESSVYFTLKNELINYIDTYSVGTLLNPQQSQLCFYPSQFDNAGNMPNITFNFGGAYMKLPIRNYLFYYYDTLNKKVICLAMMPKDVGYSVLGNFQQQNFQFLYDLQNRTLSFGSVDCSGLRPRNSTVHCERLPSPSTSNGAGVELGGRVAALLPFSFFFYYLFVPFLVI